MISFLDSHTSQRTRNRTNNPSRTIDPPIVCHLSLLERIGVCHMIYRGGNGTSPWGPLFGSRGGRGCRFCPMLRGHPNGRFTPQMASMLECQVGAASASSDRQHQADPFNNFTHPHLPTSGIDPHQYTSLVNPLWIDKPRDEHGNYLELGPRDFSKSGPESKITDRNQQPLALERIWLLPHSPNHAR